MSQANFKSRVGTINNLPVGGTYDLLLINFTEGFPQGIIKFDIGETPRSVTGIQKVAQTYLKILFSSAGSNVLYPNQGTNFQALTINANKTTNDTIFMAELYGELRSAESQTKYILNNVTSDPASQLQSITIIGLDTSKESIIMYLKLLTGAGALAQVAVPFPQLNLIIND